MKTYFHALRYTDHRTGEKRWLKWPRKPSDLPPEDDWKDEFGGLPDGMAVFGSRDDAETALGSVFQAYNLDYGLIEVVRLNIGKVTHRMFKSN